MTLLISMVFLNLVYGQQDTVTDRIPAHYYSGIHKYLSSELLEGREIGNRGNALAAGFIASQFESFNIQPVKGSMHYFQAFNVLKYRAASSILQVTNEFIDEQPAINLVDTIDYELIPGSREVDATVPIIFAGYGIYAPGSSYNDYEGLDVKNKIVVFIEGLPGSDETPPTVLKKFQSKVPASWAELEQKTDMARKLGALAVIEVRNTLLKEAHKKLESTVKSADDSIRNLPYEDAYYTLTGDTASETIPVLRLNRESTLKLFSVSDYRLDVYIRFRDQQPESSLVQKVGLNGKIQTRNHSETIPASNILGLIRGKDTTLTVIVGAHYDHLGKRNTGIYCGADDNASGVAAMLGMARYWSEKKEAPPCDLVFASWSAEEKGLLGSRYFMNFGLEVDSIALYINMDMVSRSDPADSLERILSIGTLPISDSLRSMAMSLNNSLPVAFQLDLWDVTGHTGSDYASFIDHKIPVMTFFSGFHDDYHSPLDTYSRVDSGKMGRVIGLVNDCLEEYLEKEVKKD